MFSGLNVHNASLRKEDQKTSRLPLVYKNRLNETTKKKKMTFFQNNVVQVLNKEKKHYWITISFNKRWLPLNYNHKDWAKYLSPYLPRPTNPTSDPIGSYTLWWPDKFCRIPGDGIASDSIGWMLKVTNFRAIFSAVVENALLYAADQTIGHNWIQHRVRLDLPLSESEAVPSPEIYRIPVGLSDSLWSNIGSDKIQRWIR